jgi:glycosyltransferase involved in cell wall biosynthesis
MNFKVVVPAFKRAKSLDRLLDSLFNASRYGGKFSILVSLEGGHSSDVLEIAIRYKNKFEHSQYDYIIHPQQLGLKNHILWCGNLTNQFENIIVLEDDLLVDRYFVDYATSSTSFYSSDISIAGIALYSPQYNEIENLPFYPVACGGCTTYLMQVPCSWGQIWTRRQWTKFYEWYQENQNIDFSQEITLPQVVRNWPHTSWKKYFWAYLLSMKKYIVYPYRSYSTNCSDRGGYHNVDGINYLQVPLLNIPLNLLELKYMRSSESITKYDSYFERQDLALPLYPEVQPANLAMDIYSSKPIELLRKSEFVLTTRTPGKSIGKFPLHFKPIELNLEYPDSTLKACISLARSSELPSDSVISRLKIKYMLAQYYCSFDLAQNQIIIGQYWTKLKRLFCR